MTATDPRPQVLLTGATGNWGRAALREFRERGDRMRVVAFALDTPQDREVLDEFADMDNLTVFWGDLLNYADVQRAIRDVDLVFHVGAVVSPVADEYPELAGRVNIGSMQNIVRAVAALPDPACVGVVGIGSVAETGDRTPPTHWGRVGDPIRVSQFDEYGQTKVVAEKLLIESRLPKWAWLRQTGIFHPGMLALRDPIMTHSTLAGVMEWVTAEDSARLLAGIAERSVPQEFWGRIYNIGGGEQWRLTNWQLQTAISSALGVTDVRGWYNRNWFATRNFHGHWYTDSDTLNDLVPFRRDTLEPAPARSVATLPSSVRSAGRVPAWVVKNLVMRPLTRKPRGTMHAIAHRDEPAIRAHFGSFAEWQSIGDWTTFDIPEPSRTPSLLDHGFDEDKPSNTWDRQDYVQAAEFRGGELVSPDVHPGRPREPLIWSCAFGHLFAASPFLILTGGHWCPDCTRDSAGYERTAERNQFLAQLYAPHTPARRDAPSRR